MKNKHLKYFYILFILIIEFFSGCKKIPFDDRNKYYGDWKFTYTYHSWRYGQGVSSPITEEYEGKIVYDKNEKNKRSIVITCASYITMSFDLNENGTIVGCGASGKFTDKRNVSFTYSTSACSYALGGGTDYTFIGVKK
jgi:hypothetical protein